MGKWVFFENQLEYTQREYTMIQSNFKVAQNHPSILKLAPTWLPSDPKLPPKWPQRGPRGTFICQRWPQSCPKVHPTSPSRAKIATKWRQSTPQVTLVCQKCALSAPKVTLLHQKWSQVTPKSHRNGPKVTLICQKLPQSDPKATPNYFQSWIKSLKCIGKMSVFWKLTSVHPKSFHNDPEVSLK